MVDLRRTRLEALLKILDVDGAVERVDGGWVRDRPAVGLRRRAGGRASGAARDAEADAMEVYGDARSCLMEQLRRVARRSRAPSRAAGARCAPGAGDPVELDPASRAGRGRVPARPRRRRRAAQAVAPRPRRGRGATSSPCSEPRRGAPSCRAGDAGWWPAVEAAFASGAVDDELLRGVAAALKRWPWEHRPSWITWVPSSDPTREAVLRSLAEQLAALGQPRRRPGGDRGCETGRPQRELANAAHRCRNVLGAFAVDAPTPPSEPVLLLDDEIDTGWTMTVVAAELRRAGVPAVLPFVLAKR